MLTLNEQNEIPGKPYKEGYLKKQINSIFDIWNTRYFYLDNTNFAYFDDEHTDKPSQVVNLEGCIVDGVWRNGELHTFTIRSLTNDEVFFYLGAFSADEADDWIKNLKAATKLLEVDKMVDEIREGSPKAGKSLQNFERFQDIQNFKDFESENSDDQNDIYKEADLIEEEDEWFEYLAKPNRETIMNMPPQLDLAYHEFKRLLHEEDMQYNVIKSENYVNVSVHEQDPKHWIYKCSFFIKGDFSHLVKVLNNDNNEKLWNLYLTDLKQQRKLAENIQVFDAKYELTLFNFIFAIKSFYINQAWIDQDKFNLIRSSLAHSSKDYSNNLLTFDFPLEMLGIRVGKVQCSYPKCFMTIIIKLKRKGALLDKLFRKFVTKYMIAFTILRDELEELAEKAEKVEKIRPSVEAKEPPRPSVTKVERPNQISAQQVIDAFKSSQRPVAFQSQIPSILDAKTPEQKKTYEEMRKRLNAQNIELSDELMKRFVISKEYNLDDSEANIKNYLAWLKEMKFEEFKWDDPNLFSDFLQARIVKLLGFDREARPIAYFKVKNYFPGKINPELFKKHVFGFMRSLDQYMKLPVEQYSFIADLTDITKDNINFSQCMTFAKSLLSYFPQYAHRMYIVNGGFLVKMLYNAVKPILKERHRQRIVFCNTDENEAYNILKSEMDEEIIPVHLGGKNIDY